MEPPPRFANNRAMHPRLYLLLLLVAGLVLTGCISKRAQAPVVIQPGPWALVELAGRPVSVTDALRQPSMRFDPAAGRVSGNAGVNRYNGTYTQEGMVLSFGPAAVTKMAGPPELMSIETEFLALLSRVRNWRMDTSWLVLLGPDGEVLARFVIGQNP